MAMEQLCRGRGQHFGKMLLQGQQGGNKESMTCTNTGRLAARHYPAVRDCPADRCRCCSAGHTLGQLSVSSSAGCTVTTAHLSQMSLMTQAQAQTDSEWPHCTSMWCTLHLLPLSTATPGKQVMQHQSCPTHRASLQRWMKVQLTHAKTAGTGHLAPELPDSGHRVVPQPSMLQKAPDRTHQTILLQLPTSWASHQIADTRHCTTHQHMQESKPSLPLFEAQGDLTAQLAHRQVNKIT